MENESLEPVFRRGILPRPYQSAPKSDDVPSRICPFCKLDATLYSKFDFTIHMRQCYNRLLESLHQEWLEKMWKEEMEKIARYNKC